MTPLMFPFLCLLLSAGPGQSCYLDLVISGSGGGGGGGGGGISKSIEYLAEASPAVLTGRVLATSRTGRVSKRRQSAEIQVVEVLKGLELLPPPGNQSDRIILADGFGDPVSCLSEVFENDWLIFFLSKSGAQLLAHYASPSSAVAQWTEANLARVSTALGWYSWSSWTECSRNCGTAGVRERARNCAGPPCDYGDTRQTVPCNRWPCGSMQPAQPQMLSNLNSSNAINESAAVLVDAKQTLSLSGGKALALTISPISTDIQIALETVAKDRVTIVTLTSRSNLWTIIWNARSVTIYLRIKSTESNGSFVEFAVECLSSGRVPVTGIGSTFVLTPGKVLSSANFVPWSEATDCSKVEQMTPPPTYWTAWSSCSATCGEGIRTRHSVCRSSPPAAGCHPAGSRPPLESGPCPSLPLCNPDHNPGSPASGCACLNGGFCFKSRCVCPTSHTGNHCQTLIVEQQAPTQPKLPPPTPLPSRRRSKFDCRRQSIGGRRRRRKNATVCRNGGVCDPRRGGHCHCPMGWSGRRCRKPECRPRCRNGGACVSPNLCACAAGFSGTQCQNVDCYPPCVNGGTCIRPGKCSCPPGYRGRFCHRVRCHRSLCLNGGRCLEADGLCRCRAGFYGARCERRNCTPELSYRKTYRPVVKRLRRPTVQPCSPGSKRYCLLTNLTQVVVFKIVLRPYFTCSSA